MQRMRGMIGYVLAFAAGAVVVYCLQRQGMQVGSFALHLAAGHSHTPVHLNCDVASARVLPHQPAFEALLHCQLLSAGSASGMLTDVDMQPARPFYPAASLRTVPLYPPQPAHPIMHKVNVRRLDFISTVWTFLCTACAAASTLGPS